MTDTLSKTAGTLGLPQNATKDLFAQQEEDVIGATKRALDELRSTTTEGLAGRGLGLSTFSEGLIQKKESDVLSNVLSGLTQQQTGLTSDLFTRQFQSGLDLGELEATADLKSRIQKEGFTSEILQELFRGGLTSLAGQDDFGFNLETLTGAGAIGAQQTLAKGILDLFGDI